MSHILDTSSEDEEDSYRNLKGKKAEYNSDDATIIDDSTEDTSESRIDHDSESSLDNTEANVISSAKPNRESSIKPVKKRVVPVIDSEDDSDSTPNPSVIDTPPNNSVSVSEIPQDTHGTNSEDIHNLSAKMGNVRFSQHFQFNSEGILNSTALHPRPSGNFREPKEMSDPSLEIVSDHDSDIIEVSSDECASSPVKTPFKLPITKKIVRQQTLQAFVKTEIVTPQKQKQSPKPPAESQTRPPLMEKQSANNEKPQSPRKTVSRSEYETNNEKPQTPKITVSRSEYETQWSKVNNLEIDLVKLQSMTDNINFEALPDKGQLIKERIRIAEGRYAQEKKKLDQMNVSESKVDEAPKGAFANVAWEDIEAGANAVLPKTFGKTAMSTYNAQKAVTLDRLQQLHEALLTCPKDEDYAEDPEGIKVPLMPHQKRALAWIMFREKEKPSGGILADDMGLGKTLTMISLIVKTLELENHSDDENDEYIGKKKKYNGGSLIVCPASLISQWSGEIERRLQRGLISYYVYHGARRETSPKKLAEYDVVITTYSIINNEAEKASAAFKIKWRRIILDEAHTIRNYKAQTSVACCQLLAKSRWALTGTPLHNKELDMYALLKFLRCSPFDDLQVWKRWVGDKSSGGIERLHTVISSLMLRRTKAELMEKGALKCLPEKKWELVKIELDKDEMKIYQKVLIFSQTLFSQYLYQRAEKNQDYTDQRFTDIPNNAPNQEYFKMRQKLMKVNKVKDVSQHEILVLLLRLRQICCHPSLITAMLDECREDIGEREEEAEQLNLLDQLEKLNIDDEEQDSDEYKPDRSLSDVADGISQDARVTLKEASRGQLHPNDPVFAVDRMSSKIKALLKVLKERILGTEDKAIIVSQWPSYLNLVATHLKNLGVKFDQLDGKIPVDKRGDMVNNLNNPNHKLKILLLSLTAGGVGLNLVGANHLFLLDLHWNPQLENQAQDRIYRMGQPKPVFVYKFMALDTIEERIKGLQEKKLAMADGILTGTKQTTQSKLTLDDLRTIFGM